MRTSSVRTSRAVLRTAITIACLAPAIACGPAGREGTDSASGRTAATSVDSARGGQPQRVGPPYQGTLPDSIHKLDAARFAEFVGQKRYKGRTIDRDCSGSDCGPGRSTKIKIEAIEDAYEVDYINLPRTGVIVGRMRNIGPHRDVKYDSLPPNDPNTAWYLLWTRATNGNAAFLHFVQLKERGPGAPVMAVLPDSFPVFDCRDQHDWKASDAGFKDEKDCRQRLASDSLPFAAPVSRVGTAWLSCAQGCCTADFSR